MPVITFKYQDLKDLGIDMEKKRRIDKHFTNDVK